ncbi:MAG: hypothetical protein IPN94_14310 [Sphingobacteriales bacterium]|jgi:hypothetical protein|nr:hypothetical protein [Sphingobacteriales bacterium]
MNCLLAGNSFGFLAKIPYLCPKNKPNIMETINFNDCSLGGLEDKFALQPQRTLSSLTNWLATNSSLIDAHQIVLKQLTQILSDNAAHWNEQDLSMHFIGPMFSLVGFTERSRFNLFAQSSLTGIVDGVTLTGRVDELIASGFRIPKVPFFAFNEYKKEMEYKGDPAGQALAAMLVGQSLNDNTKPIYGCYVIGSIWRFMTLEAKRYAISKSYDGTDFEDACQILRILFQLKEYCMERTQAPAE